MKKKQTAVDYLVKELSAILGHLETKPMQDLLMVDAINKAKQIEEEQIIDAMCQQLQMEVNASETQKYYKSKEVQDLDNPTDVVDEYPKTLPLKRNGEFVGEVIITEDGIDAINLRKK